MRETAPASAAASNSLSHLGSFTHTFPTGMERLQPARRANGEHTRFHAAHMAANLRRIFSTFVWIITLVSSSRTRIYPPNEGECGGWNRPSCATRSPYSFFFFPFPLRRGLETPRLALGARPRMVKESGAKMCMKLPEKLDFAGRFLQLVFVAELCIPPLPLKGVHLQVLSCCCHGNLEILGYFLMMCRANSLV